MDVYRRLISVLWSLTYISVGFIAKIFAVGYSVVLNEQSYIPDSGRFNDYVETLPQFHSRYQIEFGAV